ncbi:MAG: hypothetical protein HYZ58_02500, partial [Acidobacteria bacterium]|nr:hypothetical protein [Acidobacteriota bacterium]
MALVPFRKKDQSDDQESRRTDLEPWESDQEEPETGPKMSFLEHLEELRKRIVNGLIAIGVGMCVSFFFID